MKWTPRRILVTLFATSAIGLGSVAYSESQQPAPKIQTIDQVDEVHASTLFCKAMGQLNPALSACSYRTIVVDIRADILNERLREVTRNVQPELRADGTVLYPQNLRIESVTDVDIVNRKNAQLASQPSRSAAGFGLLATISLLGAGFAGIYGTGARSSASPALLYRR